MNNIKMWTIPDIPIEEKAREQIEGLSHLPVLAGPIAIMPDVHWGRGATIGSVIPTSHAIIPAAVGVDIGCGMAAIATNVSADRLPDNLGHLRAAIEQAIPVGFKSHDMDRALDRVMRLDGHEVFEPVLKALRQRFHNLTLRGLIGDKSRDKVENAVWKQVGTLGGGNHFIELQIGDDGNIWLMLHSGSRYVGKSLADVAISQARFEAEQRGDVLPDKDMAWLVEGSDSFDAYIDTLTWAQDYARTNREMMLALLWSSLRPFFPPDLAWTQMINCHHNYVERVTDYRGTYWLTRKGAVSARLGELAIIPGSMGTSSYIVRGKGNPESYYSCSHGAGRQMSRHQAQKSFTLDDLIVQTRGVESRKDNAILDEIPGAYKDIDAVIQAQSDLIEPVVRLKQILCVKG
ncbi:MAG: RtcB family protein [Firmicutes bacterium]|nr:RtcB family protein [Bacillota bacterium]